MSSRLTFESVVTEVYAPLQRYLRRRVDAATADDVLGDVLLVLWRRVEDIPTDATLPWCYAVARRCLANTLRGSERHLRLVHRIATEPPPSEVDDDPVLADALAALPAADRELLRLWAWEQLSPAEIAVVLDITSNAVSIRLHRAKQKLRNRLVQTKEPHYSRTTTVTTGKEASR